MKKGNICLSKASPPGVFKAYFEQFEKDFTLFLRSRAEEIVPGGGMVLTILGSIQSHNPCCIWELVGITLNDMVLQRKSEGSFTLKRLQNSSVDSDANMTRDKYTRGEIVANTVRAIIDDPFARFTDKLIVVSQMLDAISHHLHPLEPFYEEVKKEKGGRFGACFIVGAPGSFYGSLFPNNTMHFVPKEPGTGQVMNKGNICIAKTSPPGVFKAYYEQFERDLTLFLESRAEEIVPGGGMLLTVMGSIQSNDPCSIWELVGITLNDMVLQLIMHHSNNLFNQVQGLIQEAKLDSSNLPYYAPTAEESRGEPILRSHFGEEISDDLFARFAKKVIDCMAREKRQYLNLVISLTKKA
ncbi:hypothetical protein AAG906_002984 [Vitis piasezkii]